MRDDDFHAHGSRRAIAGISTGKTGFSVQEAINTNAALETGVARFFSGFTFDFRN
jgi:hypothetical protein